ncbi:uncharacterized protein LOC110419078 [Herrania umbratica]|uniref:Uncharacterized protein LOC110419078 n=1 Tax=Herrania umbratica TaxID=108875 RepID=A0A6J1AL11_9ROSI|nr:uncharacterized protein LOC110419078 [Herrania umbratica]
MAQVIGETTKKSKWLIDSAYSNHLIGDESQFTTLDRSYRARVEIGNGSFLKIVGVGTVAVETKLGSKYISNVYLVLEASQNLLNVGQLTESNYVLLFKDKHCIVSDSNGDMVFTVQMRNKCYLID